MDKHQADRDASANADIPARESAGVVSNPGVTFILGGARSGKSVFAEDLMTHLPPPWIYIATAQVRDQEMHARIALHRARRGDDWQLIEAPLDLPEALASLPQGRPVLIDCLTLWLSNVMAAAEQPCGGGAQSVDANAALASETSIKVDTGADINAGKDEVAQRCDRLIDVLSKPRGAWIVVSSEVGQGIVPQNALAREFRDQMGQLNRRVVALADRAQVIVAGLPLILK